MTYNPPCFGYCRWINLNILNLSCTLATLAKEASITTVWIDETVKKKIFWRRISYGGKKQKIVYYEIKCIKRFFPSSGCSLCYSHSSCFTYYENNVIYRICDYNIHATINLHPLSSFSLRIIIRLTEIRSAKWKHRVYDKLCNNFNNSHKGIHVIYKKDYYSRDILYICTIVMYFRNACTNSITSSNQSLSIVVSFSAPVIISQASIVYAILALLSFSLSFFLSFLLTVQFVIITNR